MICVSFNSNIRLEELKKLINKNILIELRTDLLGFEDIKTILKNYKKVILSLKNISLDKALDLIKYKPNGLDIDLFNNDLKQIIEEARKINPNIKIIISYHNQENTPTKEEFNALIDSISEYKASYIKLATYVKEEEDSVRLLNLLDVYDNLIVVGLGPKGLFVRLMGFMIGSKLTYLTIAERTRTAPNQYTVKEFMEYINYDFSNTDWI